MVSAEIVLPETKPETQVASARFKSQPDYSTAPTLAVDILSPDDRPDDVRERIAIFLAAGTTAAYVRDPRTRTAIVHDRNGDRSFEPDASVEHEAFAGPSISLDRTFAREREPLRELRGDGGSVEPHVLVRDLPVLEAEDVV